MNSGLTILVRDRRVALRQGAAVIAEHTLADEAGNPVAPVAALRAVLEQAPKQARAATLVIPSSWCYVQRFAVAHRRPSATMLRYAFEEYLPVGVEELTCAFVRVAPGEYLGIGLPTERGAPLVAAVEEAGLYLERLTLDVLAAPLPAGDGHVLWADHDHAAILAVSNGKPADLRIVRLARDLTPEAWAEALVGRLENRNGSCLRVSGCVDAAWLEALRTSVRAPSDAVRGDTGFDPAELDLAHDALAPRQRTTQLRRLGRRSAALATAALVLVSLGLFLHARQLRQRSAAIGDWQRTTYSQLFPGSRVPAGVGLRLASERRRLEVLTGATRTEHAEPPDALTTLQRLVAAVPADLRLELHELRIENATVTLRGRTRDHREAERLAQAVGSITGLSADAPRSDSHRDGGVQFFLAGRYAAEPDRGGRKP